MGLRLLTVSQGGFDPNKSIHQVGETPHSPTIIIGRERSFFTGRISDDNFNVSYTVGLRPGSSVGHTGAYHATKRDEYATIVWLL